MNEEKRHLKKNEVKMKKRMKALFVAYSSDYDYYYLELDCTVPSKKMKKKW